MDLLSHDQIELNEKACLCQGSHNKLGMSMRDWSSEQPSIPLLIIDPKKLSIAFLASCKLP